MVKRNLIWLTVLSFMALYPVTIGRMSPYYSAVLIFVGIYVILAVSLDLLVGYAGQISLGHAAFFAIGAYVSGILTTKYGISPLFALLAGLLLSGLIAWFVGRSVLALKGYYLAMATLGLTAIIYTLIVGLQWLTGGATGLRDIPSFSIFSFSLDNHLHYYYFVWAIVFLVLVSCLAITNSSLGRTLVAIHGDEIAASTLGVDCAKYKICIFTLSSVYAALAGSLFAHYMGFISPDNFSVFTSIYILIMLFLGGVGTIYGPALGAIFLKLLPEITYVFHEYEILANGLILILVLIFMPKGLIGIFATLADKLSYSRTG